MIILQFLDQVYWGNTIQNYIWFGGIFFFGLIFKRLISKLISRFSFKLFKRFAGAETAERFIELLVKPIEVLLLIVTIYLAINQLDHPLNKPIFNRKAAVETTINQAEQAVEKSTSVPSERKKEPIFQSNGGNKVKTYADFIDRLFLLFALGAFFWILLRIADFIAYVLLNKAEESDSKAGLQIIPFTRELVKILVGSLGFFVIMSVVFNLNIGLIVSGLGIGGLALALAGKETVENLFGAFTIFIDKPFVVGDLVNVGGVEGTVEKVGFRSTLIRTTEKSLVSMPNKRIVDNPMDNLTLKTHRRIKYNLGLGYSTTQEQMKQIIADIKAYFKTVPQISDDSIVAFDSFGESALNIMVMYFIEMLPYAEHVKIKEETTYKILEIVNKYKAEIAFPTRKVLHENIDGSNPPITFVD
ncbi:mechanosensitive ion channel family protein [Solitalea lacus]|uniref:mechanosensitive ion channel family protein n=1 Tax=Solitalea lacus TaxID=2911172 RepID=UPI001EDC3818|nr:mechanosensitive ion channel family protein [Solitalea lacus]UKJ07838.1 mechanosensitive ion channel family protein [Solitalea lacus]